MSDNNVLVYPTDQYGRGGTDMNCPNDRSDRGGINMVCPTDHIDRGGTINVDVAPEKVKQVYIGETSRNLRTRAKEHLDNARL